MCTIINQGLSFPHILSIDNNKKSICVTELLKINRNGRINRAQCDQELPFHSYLLHAIDQYGAKYQRRFADWMNQKWFGFFLSIVQQQWFNWKRANTGQKGWLYARTARYNHTHPAKQTMLEWQNNPYNCTKIRFYFQVHWPQIRVWTKYKFEQSFQANEPINMNNLTAVC